MPEDVDHRQPPAEPAPPTPSDFDQGFAASAASDGLRRVWRAAEPDLPVEILTGTGLPDATADAAVCVDAMHFPAEPTAAAAEAARILRPAGRLVLTNWQPRNPQDSRLPHRLRHRAWGSILEQAGFTDVRVEARPDWHDAFTRVYRTALDAGDPAGDTALADLQDEARRRLETADLVDRVVASGTKP